MFKPRINKDKKFTKPGEKRPARVTGFKKNCVFCKKELPIDYKNIELISRYISGKGKILSRRFSGNCAKHQRRVTEEINHARYLGLLTK